MKSIRMLAVAAGALTLAGLAPAVAASAATPSVTTQWAKTFDVKGAAGYGYAAVASPDGSAVYVAGQAKIGEVAAYNAATGAFIWKHDVSGGGTKVQTELHSVAVSPNGSTVIVTGYTQIPGVDHIPFHQVIAAYNATTGAKLWQLISPAVSGASPAPVTVSPDSSTVYVTDAGLDQTVAYNAATGAALWTEPGGGAAIDLSSDGSTLFVAGEPDGTEAFTASTGATDWQDSVTGTLAALSPDGTALYVSQGEPAGSSASVVTTAVSTATGSTLWSADTGLSGYAGMVNGVVATASAVIVSTSLWTDHDAKLHWQTVAFNPATGASLWSEAQYGSGGFANATSVVLSPDGTTAYVTGYDGNTGAGSGHIVTNAYDTATGAKDWTVSYYGQTTSFGYANALSPDGSQLFVTGTITIAFSTS
jgi:outer membrane protein assembly factor BamB